MVRLSFSRLSAQLGLAVLLLVLAGCGDQCPSDGERGVVLSSVTNSEPMTASTEGLVGTVTYHGFANSRTVSWTRPGVVEHTVETGTFDVAGISIHLIFSPEDAGATGEAWILGRPLDPTTGEATTEVVLRRYLDANADGLFDTNTFVAAFSMDPGRDVRLTASGFDDQSGTLYFFDSDLSDLFVAWDTNADLRPDTTSSVPFVAGNWSDDPDLPGEDVYVDPETGEVATTRLGPAARIDSLWEPGPGSVIAMGSAVAVGRFTDTNADHVADSFETITAVGQPGLLDPAIAGMTEVALLGARSSEIALDVVDAEDVLLETLGSGVIPISSANVTLSRALVEGERVRARDIGTSEVNEPTRVTEIIAWIRPKHLATQPTEQAAQIVLEGFHLSRLSMVRLARMDEETKRVEITLFHTVSPDGKSVALQIPALDESWEGGVLLEFIEGTGPSAVAVATMHFDVCAVGDG